AGRSASISGRGRERRGLPVIHRAGPVAPRGAAAPTRSRAWRALPLLAFLLLAGGGGCTTMSAAGDSVAFRVETNVPDAMVWVDDHLVGTAASLVSSGTRLRVGFHRIELRHPSHYSFFAEVDPKKGEDVLLRAPLHELVQ